MKAAAALVVLCGAALLPVAPARAEARTASGGGSNAPLSASARLDFVLRIGRFIFFRVGPGAFPTTSPDPASVSITLQPSIPAAPTVPTTTGNGVLLPWSGGVPTFSPVPAGSAIPVQVQSNAGPITIRANVVAPLTSGSNSIPLSQILVSSSDPGLPAPVIPDSGTGASVGVTGTAFGNLVTVRSADWTFSYNPAVVPPPGTYSGQISFTAVSP